MTTNEETISEQSQIYPLKDTTSSTDKTMNDSLEKAAFGRKHLRRRSSLFFRNTEVNNAVPDDVSNFNCRSSSGKTLEGKVITLGNKRRTSMNLRKSIYRTRSKVAPRKFEITCEPPPVSLKPILLNITQKTVRRITMKAKGWNKHKRVHFDSVPHVHEITPRSGKIPGVVKMPDSPPTVKELVIKEIASDNKEFDIPTTQSVILQDTTTNTFQNEIVRFLPAISQTFQCHLDEEKIVNECLEAKNDEGSSDAVDNDDHTLQSKKRGVGHYMNRKRAVNRFEVSDLSETVKRPKRRVEEKAITWVRGDRLRNLSLGIKQDVNDDKENANLNILNDKQSNDEQKCNEASDSLQHLRASLLVVPRTGPKAKVKKWLQDLPNQWCHQAHEEDAFMWNQQEQITDESIAKCDSILIQKHSLRRQSFGGLPKKQDKGNKSCRKSLLFQKTVSKLSGPNRSQTIIVGEVKGNVYGESSFSNLTCAENVDQTRCCSASAVSCSRNTDEVDDEVVLLDDQGLTNIPGNSLIFYKNKIDTRNTRQTTTNKAETVMKSSLICGDKLVGEEMNSLLRHEKKTVFMDEMDFAPFPSVSNIGYAEILSVNYDLPCELRQHQIPKMVLYNNNNTFQISFRRKSFCEDELEQNVGSHIPLRSRSARKKLSKSGRWNSLTEELQENTWSEALRPMETDELIIDGPTVRKLCDWINMWKERLRKSRDNKKDIIVPSRRKKRDSDSFDSCDSDEVEQLCNTAIIYGHCGSGKTSLVYAVSKRYEMHVLEIASNEKRNGLQLKCKLQGATHSHKFPMSTMVNQMFFRNEKNDGKMIEDSIILVDDCDVIYDKHDDGFWPALRALCREARTPIIIICEDISLVRRQLGFEVPVLIFSLIRPEVQSVSSHLQKLCAALDISVCSDTCCALAEQYNGDLRACINQLQFYSGEDSNNCLRMVD